MKKRTILALVVILILVVLGVVFNVTDSSNQTSVRTQSPASKESNRATVGNGVIDLLYFPSADARVSKDKLYVDGCILNQTDDYHITDFSDLVIEISDKDGNHLLDVEINDVYGSNNIIPPGGVVEYGLSLTRSSVNNVSQSMVLRYRIKGSCTYEVCSGEGCLVCKTKSTTNTTQNSTHVDREPCRTCDQTGKCPDCGGSGKSKSDSIVFKAQGCVLCERSGNCYKCNGNGWVPVY